jgi:hypothetical protein
MTSLSEIMSLRACSWFAICRDAQGKILNAFPDLELQVAKISMELICRGFLDAVTTHLNHSDCFPCISS